MRAGTLPGSLLSHGVPKATHGLRCVDGSFRPLSNQPADFARRRLADGAALNGALNIPSPGTGTGAQVPRKWLPSAVAHRVGRARAPALPRRWSELRCSGARSAHHGLLVILQTDLGHEI